jgi:hypothetical protein
VAVVADDRRLADDDAHAVVDEQPLADLGAGVNLDAGEHAAEVGNDARQDGDVGVVQGVGQAVQLPGVEAGIGQDDLYSAMSRRVA